MELASETFRSSVVSESIHVVGSEGDRPVLMLHGLGDFISCHDWAADILNQSGYSPMGFDWPGNGKSTGRRGDMRSVSRCVELLEEILVAKFPIAPEGVFAHSTGCFILLNYLQRLQAAGKSNPFRWIWLNSPLIRPAHNQSHSKQQAAKALEKMAPKLTLPTGVTPAQCFHVRGRNLAEIYELTRGSHSRVSIRFGNSLMRNETQTADVQNLEILRKTPVLITQGDEDRICPPQYAEVLFRKLTTDQKTLALLHGFRHEGFREKRQEALKNTARAWVQKIG